MLLNVDQPSKRDGVVKALTLLLVMRGWNEMLDGGAAVEVDTVVNPVVNRQSTMQTSSDDLTMVGWDCGV